MRSGYVSINNYRKNGEIGISRQAFDTIVRKTVENIPGAKVKQKAARWLFDWNHKLNVIIHKNESVEVAIDVAIKHEVDVQAICLKIQQEITAAISLMCETVPLKVSIRVVGIK